MQVEPVKRAIWMVGTAFLFRLREVKHLGHHQTPRLRRRSALSC